MSIIYCECVFVALDIQYAMRINHIVICGLPRSTLFHKRHDFRKEFTEQKMCFDFLYNFV